MASRDKKDLHHILANAYDKAVVQYTDKYPTAPKPFYTCTFRSGEEQNELFKKRPKVTNAKAGQSPHNYIPSLAFDLGFITLSKKLDWNVVNFKNFAEIIQAIEPLIDWGGSWVSFPDAPHYQLHNWKNYLPVSKANI